jgi:hypothetical protein
MEQVSNFSNKRKGFNNTSRTDILMKNENTVASVKIQETATMKKKRLGTEDKKLL